MAAEIVAVYRSKDYMTVLLFTLVVTLSGCGADQHTVGAVSDEREQGADSRSVSAVRLVFEEQEAGQQSRWTARECGVTYQFAKGGASPR